MVSHSDFHGYLQVVICERWPFCFIEDAYNGKPCVNDLLDRPWSTFFTLTLENLQISPPGSVKMAWESLDFLVPRLMGTKQLVMNFTVIIAIIVIRLVQTSGYEQPLMYQCVL